MAIDKLTFSRVWTNPEDFATYLDNETEIRADMQALHDETRDYVNNILTASIDANLTNIDTSVNTRIAGMDSRLNAKATELTDYVDGVDAELRADVATTDAELRATVAATDTELRESVAATDAALRADVAASLEETTQHVEALVEGGGYFDPAPIIAVLEKY